MRLLQPLLVIALLLGGSPGSAQFGTYQFVDDASATAVQAADLNGDGANDLIITSDEGIHWYRNTDGLGSMGQEQELFPLGADERALVEPADADGDGDIDLFIAVDRDSTIYRLENTNGNFDPGNPEPVRVMPARLLPAGFSAMVAADVTGDGLPELLVRYGGHEGVFRCLNNGGILQADTDLPDMDPGVSSGMLRCGDLDGDGSADILVSDVDGAHVVVINSVGDGSLWMAVDTFMAPGVDAQHVQLIDIDADGDLDVGLTGQTLQWARNASPQAAFSVSAFNGATDAGIARFGAPGCGVGASVIVLPDLPDAPAEWRHYEPALGDLGPAQVLPDVPKGRALELADLDGDARADLTVLYSAGLGWYRSVLPASAPAWTLSLPALDTLCANGGTYILPPALPINGTWYGPYTQEGQFLAFAASAGTYDVQHLVVDTGGCPVAAGTTIQLVAGPELESLVSPIPQCPEGPVQLVASPSTGTWFGPVDNAGVVDVDELPILGEVVFVMLDAAGVNCASEALWLDLLAPAALLIDVDTALCTTDAPQTVVVTGPSQGSVWISGPLGDPQYSQQNIVEADFDPAQGPGNFIITAVADGAGLCPSTVETIITVQPAPWVSVLDFDTICSSSGPYLLDQGQPVGGTWSGFGVFGDLFDVATHEFGDHELTYTFTDVTGCSATASQTITAIRRPTVWGPVEDTLVCADAALLDFNAQPVGGSWASPLNASLGTVDPALLSPLPYQVSAIYTYTDATGGQCSNLPIGFTVQARTQPLIQDAGPFCDTDAAILLQGAPPGVWAGTAAGTGPEGSFDPGLLGPGAHVVTLTAAAPGECAGTDSLVLNVVGAPGTGLQLPLDTIAAEGMPFTLSGGSPAGGAYTINGDTVTQFEPALYGLGWVVIDYTLTTGPCATSAQDSILVHQDTGINGSDRTTACSLQPNPAVDVVVVDGPAVSVRVRIVDATGRQVGMEQGGTAPLRIELHGLAAGRYSVQVTLADRTHALPLVVLRP